jgi:hypothetical protein
MTKQQRARVVELLRCSVDLLMRGHVFPRLDAIERLGPDHDICTMSFEAVQAVEGPRDEIKLLEAAARVEERSWP